MRRAPLFALLLLAGLAHAGPTVPLGATVDGLLAYAREHNPELAAMRFEAGAAGERGESAGALPDPKFRTELRDLTRMGTQDATLAPSRVGSTRYLVMQDVPWFGKRDLKREIAELEAQGGEGKARATWSELATRIKAAHARLYYLTRNEALTREVLDLLVRLEKIGVERYAVGRASQPDVLRAHVEQTGLKSELLALEAERRALQTRLNLWLNRPANGELAPPQMLRPLPAPAKLEFTALEERLRAGNPQLFADSARLRAAEKNRELVAKNRYPDFTFGVSPIQYRNAVREWELMVEVNIPLQQGSRRAQEREAEAMVSAAESRRQANANQLLADLAEQLAGLEASRQTQQLNQQSLLPQADINLRAVLAAYENGRADFATLLEAERQIRQARQSQLKAEFEAQLRLAEIERLLGDDL